MCLKPSHAHAAHLRSRALREKGESCSLLVLACCHGGYFAAERRYDEPAPFVYMVGPGNKIYPEPLFALTGGFYSELLEVGT